MAWLRRLWVARLDVRQESLVAGLAGRVAALGFVEDAPDNDARMIERHIEHFVEVRALGRHERRVVEVFGGVLPADALTEHEQADFVTQIELALVLGIVAAAHEVGVHRLDELQVRELALLGHRVPELRMSLVAIDPA